MKTAIPLDENKTDVCVSFGRAPFFLFSGEGKSEILSNPAAAARGGAGLVAAQFVLDNKADTLITVRCGENAAEVFKAAGAKIYKSEFKTAEENLKAFAAGGLSELKSFHKGFHGIK